MNHQETNNKGPLEQVSWSTPPKAVAGRRGNPRWAAIAQALRNNPGEWAMVAENVYASTAHMIRTGGYSAFAPSGSFEVTTRGNVKGVSAEVYARYVGENS